MAGRSSDHYWSQPVDSLLANLGNTSEGLSTAEAQTRPTQFGPNTLKPRARAMPLKLFLGQFRSPIVLILLFATGVSALTREWVDAVKETGHFVLLERGLAVLHQGIVPGRTTFASTLEYVFITTSANFGDVFSAVALVTLALPYSPLSGILGFTPLPLSLLLVLLGITVAYITASEVAKRMFYRRAQQ